MNYNSDFDSVGKCGWMSMFYTPKKLPGDMAAISPQFEEKEGIGFLEEAGLQS